MNNLSGLILAASIAIFASCSEKCCKSSGDTWPSEIKEFKDRITGVEIKQLTDYKGHSNHFYFTNPGWFAGGKKLLFSSARNNHVNLFSVDLGSYEIQQLTDLEPVPLPREIEFQRACRNPVKEEAYFFHDLSLISLDLNTLKQKKLLELDQGWSISMTNCSSDGKYVYFGIWEDMSDKFEVDLMRNYIGFEETWAAKPKSKIMRVATDGSGSEVIFEEKYWIGHINTSPARSDLITFCHEGPWEKVDNRIWCMNVETKEVWKVRPRNDEGERVGHEYWYADGVTIGFHGTRADGSAFLGRVKYDNTGLVENEFSKYTGHIHSNDMNLIVGDGGDEIRLWKWNGRSYDGPRMLCRHNSTMNIQQSHPHPRFNAEGTQILYTTDVSGYCNVYLVGVPEFETLPLINE